MSWDLKITPRMMGTNPRAMGTNPRMIGTNPRAREEDSMKGKKKKGGKKGNPFAK